MSELVVDVFQAVEIYGDCRDGVLVALGLSKCLPKSGIERPTIADTGQWIE